LGAHFDHESEYIGDIGSVLAGETAPASLQTVQGQRNVAAVYYQLDVPVINGVTFSQSSRYDHYSDFGGAFSPRFALRWQPVSMLTTYASYDRGFRAPTLIENSQTAGIVYVPYNSDPYNTISTAGGFAPAVTKGNPDLQPERTRNINVGFELSPDRYTDFGVDWYRIMIANVITNGLAQPLIDANDPTVVVRNPNSTIDYINLPYANIGSISTSGFEANFRRALPTSWGTFTFSGDWAYVTTFKDDGAQYAGSDLSYELPFGSTIPHWKGNTTLAWNYRKFNTTLTWQYTGPMREQLSGFQPQGVASYSQFNLMTTYSGFKHWTIYGGIDNIANKVPPYNAFIESALGSGVAYDPSQYSDIGRIIQVGATYRF